MSDGDIALVPHDEALPALHKAIHWLAKATNVPDVKEFRDQAAAYEYYYRRHGASEKAANGAAEIRLRAERRMGELLPPERPGKRTDLEPVCGANRLSRFHSHQYRVIAAAPARAFHRPSPPGKCFADRMGWRVPCSLVPA